MTPRLVLISCLAMAALAGCLTDPAGSATPDDGDVQTHHAEGVLLSKEMDLTTGADGGGWAFEVPLDPRGHIRLAMAGWSGTPMHVDSTYCIKVSWHAADGGESAVWSWGADCGGPGNLVVNPSIGVESHILWEVHDGDVRPGMYAIHVDAAPQPASLRLDVDLAAS